MHASAKQLDDVNTLIARLCDGDRHDPQERSRYTIRDVEEMAESTNSEEQKKVSL
ncbi:hypothetical protein SAMN05421543_10934 [Alicyclobacillus macrosporangiidus]|uniref:Uncharacterized protein n=1 Tax=Alicyclobacillus macrosporangiidus TaxID=392015 RepID=A0A1I7JA03_9BACL|nr:hypothetical protein SAMN05421543_10934 [Alicyclobacillus macrosporangiidus]